MSYMTAAQSCMYRDGVVCASQFLSHFIHSIRGIGRCLFMDAGMSGGVRKADAAIGGECEIQAENSDRETDERREGG